MKYFLDTEFVEGFRKPLFGKSRHFIDLISIGLVAEDDRTYYAVSKEFDLKYVWNNKDTWVKKNVLYPLHAELLNFEENYDPFSENEFFSYHSIKRLLNKYGKTEKQIAFEIMCFVFNDAWSKWIGSSNEFFERGRKYGWSLEEIIFYSYYGDYDWVLFCSLFGRMIDLPTGFPMLCLDLKQTMAEIGLTSEWKNAFIPDPIGEHNALVDAKWNKELYLEIMNAKHNKND